ncbi:MAG: Ig-like domain-containing protein, partial [Gemmatimonadota bacterium]|nr:Ig-like domain-containing protein [Gemmatimonadota bacterium]
MQRLIVLAFFALLARPLAAQTVTRLVSEPARVEVVAGQSVPLVVRALGPDGRPVAAPLRVGGSRDGVRLEDGQVTGLAAGEYMIFVSSVPEDGSAPVVLEIPVVVDWPAVERVEVVHDDGRLFVGSRIEHDVVAVHADGSERPYPEASWSSTDPSVASVDDFGNVRGVSPGTVSIVGTVDGVSGRVTHSVSASPVERIVLRGGQAQVRTGDVQNFVATAVAADGSTVSGAPISWSYAYQPDDSIVAPAGPAQILRGRMVADVPGVYTAVASTGGASAEYSFRVVPRGVVRKLDVVGQGREARVFTTDLWI